VGLPKEELRSIAPIHERQTVLESDSVVLWYYPELKIVHHRMISAPASEQFRELLTRGAEVAERYGAPKWLSDDRGNVVLRDFDEKWSDREWLPRMLRAGFKYWAIVLPDAAIGKLNMRRLAADHARRGIVSSAHVTPEAAFKWLRAQ